MSKYGLFAEKQTNKEKDKYFNNIFRVKKSYDYTEDEKALIWSIISYKDIMTNNKILFDENVFFDRTTINLINNQIDKTSKYNNIILYGSNIYKGNVMSGDIDLMQTFPVEKHFEIIQSIVRYLYEDNPDLYNKEFIGDIKCGFLTKFKPLYENIGKISNGKVINYNPDVIKYTMNKRNSEEIEKTKDMFKIPEKINNNNDLIEWLKLYNTCHMLYTRRWKPEEIIQGFIKEEDGTKYLLSSAVYDSELTKIDLYATGGSEIITEVTNVIKRLDEKYNLDNFINGLLTNMLIQYYVNNNKLKSIKRLYAYKRIIYTKIKLQNDKNKLRDEILNLHNFTQRSIVSKYNFIHGNLKLLKEILNDNYQNMIDFNEMLKSIDIIHGQIIKLYDPYYKEYKIILKQLQEIIIILTEIGNKYEENEQIMNEKELSMINNLLSFSLNFFKIKIEEISQNFIKDNNIDFIEYVKYIK